MCMHAHMGQTQAHMNTLLLTPPHPTALSGPLILPRTSALIPRMRLDITPMGHFSTHV